MSSRTELLAQQIATHFADRLSRIASTCGELSYELGAADLLEVCATLRDAPQFRFEQLIDLTGVDHLTYGQTEWTTYDATESGFSRGVHRSARALAAPASKQAPVDERRFAVVYHLLSVAHNARVRLRVFCPVDGQPMIDSVVGIWASANWFEREAFDLFGILFKNHPDLRRILTDYGFIGHPFRKDFPLIGNVEVRYDEQQKRVVYQPVTIEPRTLVPRVIRDDNRYDAALK